MWVTWYQGGMGWAMGLEVEQTRAGSKFGRMTAVLSVMPLDDVIDSYCLSS